jgi:hypothetical protein
MVYNLLFSLNFGSLAGWKLTNTNNTLETNIQRIFFVLWRKIAEIRISEICKNCSETILTVNLIKGRFCQQGRHPEIGITTFGGI